MGDQCSRILWIPLVYDLTFPQTYYKNMNCLKCIMNQNNSPLNMSLWTSRFWPPQIKMFPQNCKHDRFILYFLCSDLLHHFQPQKKVDLNNPVHFMDMAGIIPRSPPPIDLTFCCNFQGWIYLALIAQKVKTLYTSTIKLVWIMPEIKTWFPVNLVYLYLYKNFSTIYSYQKVIICSQHIPWCLFNWRVKGRN